MIAFDHVTVSVGHAVVLSDVTFRIDAGDKALIYGPTGSGKSTILTTLMGAHVPTTGMVLFARSPVNSVTIGAVRNRVAFIGQEPILGAPIVREAVLLPFSFRANRHITPTEGAIRAAFDRVHLPHRILESSADLVSGGEKQRIAIARALLLKKQVFLADEITSALDEQSTNVILELFLDSDYTVLAVSHHPVWQRRFPTRIELRDGRIVRIVTRSGEQ